MKNEKLKLNKIITKINIFILICFKVLHNSFAKEFCKEIRLGLLKIIFSGFYLFLTNNKDSV